MSDNNEKEIEVWVRAESGGLRTHYGRVNDSVSGSIGLDGIVYINLDEGDRRLFVHMSIGPNVEPKRIRHLTQEVSDDVFRLVAALREASGTDTEGLRKKRVRELRMELAELEKMDAKDQEATG